MQSFKWYSSVYLEGYIYLIFNRNARGQYNIKYYLTNIWIPISGPSHLHNGNIFSSKTMPLYWIVPLVPTIRWANNGPQCWLTRSMINPVHFYYIFPELVCVIRHCLKGTLGSWIKRMRYIVMLYRMMNQGALRTEMTLLWPTSMIKTVYFRIVMQITRFVFQTVPSIIRLA